MGTEPDPDLDPFWIFGNNRNRSWIWIRYIWYDHDEYRTEMSGVKKIDSEPDPVPKTKTPNPALYPVSLQILDYESSTGSGSLPISVMLLHTFYIHHTRGVRSLIFPTPSPLLCFKNWLLLLVWLLITQNLFTPNSCSCLTPVKIA